MRRSMIVAAAGLLIAAVPAFAQSQGYDENWYRAPFWSGEYPDGFSVVKTTTVELRATPDPKAAKTISCELPQGATYQPWNAPRVEEQALAFVSYTRIANYEITKAYDAKLYRSDDATEVPISFKPGDVWHYLAYYGEGAFLMEYEGVHYDGDQALSEVSDQQGDSSGYEEWLRINCSNSQWGWLFMGDIVLDQGEFITPNITEYGMSKDLD